MTRSIASIRARITATEQAVRELQRLEALLVQQGEETRSSDMMSAAYHVGSARVRALCALDAWQADLCYLAGFEVTEQEAEAS